MTAIVGLSTYSFAAGQSIDVNLFGGTPEEIATFTFDANNLEPWFTQTVDATGAFSITEVVPGDLPIGKTALYVTLDQPAVPSPGWGGTGWNLTPWDDAGTTELLTTLSIPVEIVAPAGVGSPLVTLSTYSISPGQVLNAHVSGGTPGMPVTITTPKGFTALGKLGSTGDAYLTVLLEPATPPGPTSLTVTVGLTYTTHVQITVVPPSSFYYATRDGGLSGVGSDGTGAWGPNRDIKNAQPPDLLFAGGRWRLWDPVGDSAIYEFPLNPSSMASPLPSRTISPQDTTAVSGQTLLWEGVDRPYEWQFSGHTRGQDMYLKFAGLARLNRRMCLGDHRGRVWIVSFEDFQATPVRNVADPWYHEYTMRCIIYAQVPGVPDSTFTSLFSALIGRYF